MTTPFESCITKVGDMGDASREEHSADGVGKFFHYNLPAESREITYEK